MTTAHKNQMETRQRKIMSIDRICMMYLNHDTDTKLNDLWKDTATGALYSPVNIWKTSAFFIADFKKIAGNRCIFTSCQKKGTFARLKKI
jgi:hypothetical protein